MLPALLTTVFFALSGITATRIARLLGGVAANFWRVVWATLLLALWSHLFGAGLTGKAFPLFFLSGVVGFGVGDVALYQALPRIGSRLSILLVHCLAAPFGALVEWLWLGTVLSVPQMFCAAIILAGVALALGPDGHLNLPRRTWMIGTAFGVVAAVDRSGRRGYYPQSVSVAPFPLVPDRSVPLRRVPAVLIPAFPASLLPARS